jgi:ElaB/YqjD/DUF883 family membrane-anchored ribosome-binding protein
VLQVTFEGDVAMIAARNSAFSGKKDLHFGGLGANAQARLATMADPRGHEAIVRARPFLQQARDAVQSVAREAVQNANHALRNNPWGALGLGAALGLTVGYLLSRRS